MKKLNSRVLIFLIGAFFMFVGFTDVYAATLVETPVENWYYTRRGGGKPYMSAQWNLYNIDGKTVYCIEPGVNITIHGYNGEVGWINSPYSREVNEKIQLYGYYGYDYPGHQTLRYRAAAQSLIWEETGGQIVEFWTEQYGNGSFINLNKERNEIKRLAEEHLKTISLDSYSKTAVIGETTTFTDSKGLLSEFEVVESIGATTSINGNVLSVTPNKVGDLTITLKKKTYTNNPTTIFVGLDQQSQKMGYFGVDDPIRVKVKLNVVGGSLKIHKKDSDTKLSVPQGDGKFVGAVYELLDENRNLVTELIINDNASAETGKILSPNKKYILREKTASQGYLVDSNEYVIIITEDNLNIEMNVFEDIFEQRINLYKVFANEKTGIMTSEPNVTFDIYLKSTGEYYKSITTNEDGFQSVILPFGNWLFRQKNATPNYEKVEDFEINITENSNKPITKIISNAEITAKLKVVKIDKDTKEVINRSGIKFKIKSLQTNDYVCQTITYPKASTICEYETDENGVLITPYPLISGKYKLEEVDQVIDGYLWNNESIEFEIGENSEFITDEEYGILFEVKFENKKVVGSITIYKSGEGFDINENGYEYEEINLSGVKYGLFNENHELINELVTGHDCFVTLDDIPLGKYYLKELASVNNNVVDEKIYEFELKYKDQYTPLIIKTFDFKNRHAKGTLELIKADVLQNPISNVVFELYFIEGDEEGKLLGEYKTDEEGKILLNDLPVIPNTKFYFVEKETREGFILNEEKHFFEFNNDGDLIKKSLINEKIKSRVIIHKIDEEGNSLSDIEIGIYDINDNIVFSGITNELGLIETELEYGKYYYKEIKTKEGLILNLEKYDFEIKNNEEILEFDLVNEYEEIEVPNTLSNDYTILIPIFIFGIGLTLIVINRIKTMKKRGKNNE